MAARGRSWPLVAARGRSWPQHFFYFWFILSLTLNPFFLLKSYYIYYNIDSGPGNSTLENDVLVAPVVPQALKQSEQVWLTSIYSVYYTYAHYIY